MKSASDNSKVGFDIHFGYASYVPRRVFGWKERVLLPSSNTGYIYATYDFN